MGQFAERALHPVKVHLKRNPHQLYGDFMKELNIDDIPIPVPDSTPVYKKFEKNNLKISLCVYEWHNQNKCLDFHYISKRRGQIKNSKFTKVNK
ncbi:hypothetical protein RhiirA5_439130 [Rhizophagus irregularis]|uniref:Uncharacterized protein n=1 Tax=Rhizophagus irregularis TaxID=588596 RepID=A0A2N0NI90_9GLOM|nr:hypothetical protein RhiirA5_439130 [Rhizophagus irregularis]